MTNADKIRNMTNEELADFLLEIDHYVTDGKCIVVLNHKKINDTKQDIMKWLEN